MTHQKCPLCRSDKVSFVFVVDGRSFHECAECDLLFVAAEHFLSLQQEKGRYDLHENDENDQAYISHLSRLKNALTPRLTNGARGLDFGCGPCPVLARLFQKEGYAMENYDRIYAPYLPKGGPRFDFLTCCEVVEHFQDPATEFELMQTLLRPAGWIGIMTNLRDATRRSASWWYLRDPTHLCFYSLRTLEKLAHQLGWNLESAENDVALFRARQ